MLAKYSFKLKSEDRRRDLPEKIIIGRQTLDTIEHVVLKMLSFVLFYRERIQIDVNLHDDSIPYVPDIVQLDYELRPKLWIECGECPVSKLDRLAVKVPEAEIWAVLRSESLANDLCKTMTKAGLRRNRYGIVGLDEAMFAEICELLKARNEVFWVHSEFDPPSLKFDFNGLWFDASFSVLKF